MNAVLAQPTCTLARVDVARLVEHYDSREEQWWSRSGPLLLANELGVAVALTLYHPFTFHLPGGSYQPDFVHLLADGRVVVIEVKGASPSQGCGGSGHRLKTRTPNARDARSKLRAAAALYGFFVWYEVRVDLRHVEFELELMEPGEWVR